MKKIRIRIGKENEPAKKNISSLQSSRKIISKRSLSNESRAIVDEPLEVLTFGDWKQIPMKIRETSYNMETIEHKEQQSSCQSTRLKEYQEMKMRKVHESERYKPKPLFPTNNTIIRKFCIDPEKKRQSIDFMNSSGRECIRSQRMSR